MRRDVLYRYMYNCISVSSWIGAPFKRQMQMQSSQIFCLVEAFHERDSADLLAITCAVKCCFGAFLHSINNILPPLVFIKIFFLN